MFINPTFETFSSVLTMKYHLYCRYSLAMIQVLPFIDHYQQICTVLLLSFVCMCMRVLLWLCVWQYGCVWAWACGCVCLGGCAWACEILAVL